MEIVTDGVILAVIVLEDINSNGLKSLASDLKSDHLIVPCDITDR